MELIESKVVRIDEPDVFKRVECAARTCYKSEANITPDSARKMYTNLLNRNHTAMLEHAYVHFIANWGRKKDLKDIPYLIIDDCPYDPRSIVISGNVRCILNSGANDLISAMNNEYPGCAGNIVDQSNTTIVAVPETFLKEQCNICDIFRHIPITYRITCDRGVSHELVRHRTMSFAQESTRYVNYAKSQMQFIKPANYDDWLPFHQNLFIKSLEASEARYCQFLSVGDTTPQIARALLPNAIKTEVVMTGTLDKWQQFLNLRYHEFTGKVHPDMKRISTMIYEDLVNTYPEYIK